MKRFLLRCTSKLGLGVLLLATTVLAQDAEVGFRKTSQLSAQDQITQMEAYLAKMRSIVGHVSRLAEQARKEKDIIKLNCVNDKLMVVKGNITVAEQILNSLRIQRDEASRSHELAKGTILYQKNLMAGQDAEACIGEEISYVGATKVDVDVDKDIPKVDPTETPPPVLPIVRPPLASPFL